MRDLEILMVLMVLDKSQGKCIVTDTGHIECPSVRTRINKGQ